MPTLKRPTTKRVPSGGDQNLSYPEGIADLAKQFIRHPRHQHKVKISASSAVGSMELGWYRGHHSGIYDAYKTLRKAYPKAALALLDAYGMDKKGNM